MKTYEWILFDIDETLLQFDSHRGIQLMCQNLNIPFTLEDYEEYEVINKALWIDYQNGAISSDDLRYKRFDTWAQKLQRCPHELNNVFMQAMTEICAPIEGAIQLLDTLKGKVSLGMITNGFTELQKARIERVGLQNHFDLFVISEQIGIPKPQRGIFDHALALMQNPAPHKVLMIGDTLESDILGGINAGFDTCWLNMKNKPSSDSITPHYEVSSLLKVADLIKTV